MNIRTVIRTIVGIVGIIFPVGLTVLSKWPRTQETMDKPSIHDGRSMYGILNCCLWILYSSPIISPGSGHTLYLTMNAAVLVALIGYIAVLAWHAPKKGKVGILLVTFWIIMLVAALGLAFGLIKAKPVEKDDKKFSLLSAITAFMLCNIYFTLDRPYLPPLWVCVASMVDGCIWTLYSWLPPADIYLVVANGVGMLVGFIGVLLNWWWKPHTARVADSSTVQLQDVEAA